MCNTWATPNDDITVTPDRLSTLRPRSHRAGAFAAVVALIVLGAAAPASAADDPSVTGDLPAVTTADGTPPIVPPFDGTGTAQRVLITLHDGLDTDIANDITLRLVDAGAQINSTLNAVGVIEAVLSEKQISVLADQPAVASIEIDRRVRLNDDVAAGDTTDAAALARARDLSELPDGPAGTPIPYRYLIGYADDAAAHERDAVVSALGANILATYDLAFDGHLTVLTDDQLAEVKTMPGVAWVDNDAIVTLNDTQLDPPWGVDRSDQVSLPLDGAYTDRSTGSGVTAYIIDTGITPHTDYSGRLATGRNFMPNESSSATDDCNGHGTHVAGTVGGATYGLAKDVRLVPVRVFSCSGSTSTSTIVSAINWVIGDHTTGPAVANMSLGGGASSSLDAATASLVDDGVITVVAAGNSNNNACYYSPAREPSAITIGATTSSDARASFSNYGSCLDMFAPGQSITSTWISSASPSNATNTISGTSMAAPHVAGAAAVLWGEDTTASATTVTSTLLASRTVGKVTNAGASSPNHLLFLSPGEGIAPGAPTDVTAVNNNGTVTVTWAAPSDSGTGEIASYSAGARSDAGITSSATCSWTAGPLTCDIVGLTSGTWTVTVTASNPWGTSPESNPSNPITIAVTNDDWAGARTLSGASGTITDNNTAATVEPGEPALDAGTGGATRWYSLTTTGAGTAVIDTVGSSFDTVLGIYTGSSIGFLSRVTYNDDHYIDGVYSLRSRVQFATTASTTYWVRVASWGSARGDIVLNWETTTACGYAPVPNDEFCAPVTFTGTTDASTVNITNATSALEAGEPGSGYRSIWYRYTPDDDGTLTLDRTGTTINSLLQIYTGNSLDTLSLVNGWAGLDGDPAATPTAEVVVVAKQTYTIRHAAAADTAGVLATAIDLMVDTTPDVPAAPASLSLTESGNAVIATWTVPTNDGGAPILAYDVAVDGTSVGCSTTADVMTCTLDGLGRWVEHTVTVTARNSAGTSAGRSATIVLGNANDTFANANELTATSGPVTSSNAFATAETGEPAHPFGPFASMWFTYTPDVPGRLTVTTVGSNFDTMLGAHIGDRVDALTTVATNDDAGGALTSRVQFEVDAGVAHHIAVDGWNGSRGAITLNWIFEPAAAPDAPTGVRAVNIGDGAVAVTWTRGDSTVPITAQVATASPGGATCTWASGPDACTINGLTIGDTYTFTVVSSNAIGASPASKVSAPLTVADTSGRVDFAASWGQDRVDQDALPLDDLYATRTRGDGTVLYVVDTGIRPHDEFGDRLLDGYSTVAADSSWVDCHGHGTHVASTAVGDRFGLADDAVVVPVRVLDCGGGATTSGVVAGLDWILTHDADGRRGVVNLSLGGPTSPALDDAVADLVAAGFVVVVAAGNENQNACNVSPAREPSAITVAATNSADARPWFSNTGSCVDIFAPGVDIIAAGIGSDDDTATYSGTSMASPHVAGAAAMILALDPSATPADVRATLVNESIDGIISDAGVNSPNRLLRVGSPAPVAAPVPNAPTDVRAAAGNGSVTVSWTVDDTHSIALASHTVTGEPASGCTVAADLTSCVIDGLVNDVTYRFSVTSTDIDGTTSAASAEVTATPVAPEPPPEPEPEPEPTPEPAPVEPDTADPWSAPITAVSPDRLLDTRSAIGIDRITRLTHSERIEVVVAGRAGVPATGVSAVSLNVTATSTSTRGGFGYITVYPCTATVPDTSSVNFADGATVANSVLTPLSADGTVCFTVYGSAHIIADVNGAVMANNGFEPVTPTRRADTRSGLGDVPAVRVGGDYILEIPMLGRSGVPSNGVDAVTMNLTVTDTSSPIGAGYATVYDCGTTPNSSNLNFAPGDTVANGVIAPLSDTGSICVYVFGAAHVIVDVNGWFVDGEGYQALRPTRLADTRTPDASSRVGRADGTGAPIEVKIAGRAGIPTDRVTGASLNVTVTGATAAGYVTVYPCGAIPNASNVNFDVGDTVANAVFTPLSDTGTICVYVYGEADIIVDVNGFVRI